MQYDGGKNGAGVFQAIINQMPPHRVYIEAFGGSGAVIRRKRPAEFNIYVEKDPVTVAAVKSELTAPAVEIVEADFLEWLPQRAPLAWHDVLIYADPPYLRSTRSCQRDLYRCEFATEAEHNRLIDLALSLPCLWMISGYYNRLYDLRLGLEAGWRAFQFNASTRRGMRQEWVWCNFPAPAVIHDYAHLGANRTERQRIRRKKERWKAKLLKMSALERNAILEACHDVKSELSSRDPQTDLAARSVKSELSALDVTDPAGVVGNDCDGGAFPLPCQ